MSVRPYTVYKGGWENGDPITIYLNYDPAILAVNTTAYDKSSSSDFDSVFGTHLDYNMTFFVTRDITDATLAKINSFGFTDVRVVHDDTESYFFDANTYIKYTNYYSKSLSIVYFKNGSELYHIAAGGRCYSIVNPNPIYQTYNGIFEIQNESGSLLSLIWNYDVSSSWVTQFFSDVEPADADGDPYSKGGNSGEGGGAGTFSGTSDSIEFPGLPTLSATSTGFITLFNPTIAEMQSLATYMWSDVFDIGLYKTLFADPMDCILGCSIVPVAVPNGGTKTVNVGNVSTGISMTVAASQYVEVDCGTLNVEEFWGSYLDYDPYTKAEIYLPYCGTHALQVDDIMGKSVHVKYHVDILSGACCAYVKCGGSVMYSFVGQCSSSIPISANDWTNVVNGALTIAASVGSLIATGGASAPMAVGAAAAVTGTIYGGGIKQNVEKSGSMGGTGGMLAVQTPYLILTRPRQALPKKQNTYTGYPSFITTKLSDLKGYTEIDSIRITGVPATNAELNELESILKSGVIF